MCYIIGDAVYFRAFILEKCFKMIKEDSVQIPSQKSRIPSFRLDGPIMSPDSHQCLKVSSNSRLHPSGRRGNASGRSSVFDKKSKFLLRHKYGKTVASVRTLSLIREDMEKNCNRPNIGATRSGRNRYYGIFVQQKCNYQDARATLSGRNPNMESRLHSCPSGRPQLASRRLLEKS
jgi:hypothetical protein